jgi:hypothetical protein
VKPFFLGQVFLDFAGLPEFIDDDRVKIREGWREIKLNLSVQRIFFSR